MKPNQTSQDKKNWIKPNVELISKSEVSSGAVPTGTEGAITALAAFYHLPKTFGHLYHS